MSAQNPSGVSLLGVIRTLNQLQQDGAIGEWAIFGSVAYSLWTEPITTGDVDVLISVENDLEYARQLSAVAGVGSGFAASGFGVELHGTRVELLPSTLSQLYADALRNAAPHTIKGETVRLVTPPYLIVMALVAWRSDPTRGVYDEQRARRLLLLTTRETAERLVERYADRTPGVTPQRLRERFARVLA
ncbi:MAG: hypothetical protein HY681_00620 [Chloroflexi bacterium]|nr:hypothetical protein [Chloroflexota bacterium]